MVTETEALSTAGTPARALSAGNVTYVVGPLATLVIVTAGDRPGDSAVQSADRLELREPFPETVEERLGNAAAPRLGFVRLAEGLLPLGRLRLMVSQSRSTSVDGGPWLFGGPSELTWCELRMADPLPFEVLDRVRPTPQQPLPDPDWLRFLPADPVAAMRGHVAGWYADLPPADHEPVPPDRTLPEPLLALYRAAAGRREVLGVHNSIYPWGELECEDDGRVQFGAENQGVFVMLFDPTGPDPVVQYEGDAPEGEGAPLSTALLQFLLSEAAISSPFHGFATVTAAHADRLVGSLRPVPLSPDGWPGGIIRHYVAPGLVATTTTPADGSVDVYAGARHRCALRALRDPGFTWEQFNG